MNHRKTGVARMATTMQQLDNIRIEAEESGANYVLSVSGDTHTESGTGTASNAHMSCDGTEGQHAISTGGELVPPTAMGCRLAVAVVVLGLVSSLSGEYIETYRNLPQ